MPCSHQQIHLVLDVEQQHNLHVTIPDWAPELDDCIAWPAATGSVLADRSTTELRAADKRLISVQEWPGMIEIWMA